MCLYWSLCSSSLIDVVDRVVENHKAQQTNRQHTEQPTYKSSQDGSHFQENSFLSGDELRILITLYVDDFEICNPLDTSRRKHTLCGIYWTLSNLPPGSHSSLSSIYLAVLCKSDDGEKALFWQCLTSSASRYENSGGRVFICSEDVLKEWFKLLQQKIWVLTV